MKKVNKCIKKAYTKILTGPNIKEMSYYYKNDQ